MVAFLRHHRARRQSNAHAERMEPSDALGTMPGLRSNFRKGLQGGGRRREAGVGPWLPQGCGTHHWLSGPGDVGGHAGMDAWAAAASRTVVSTSEPAPGAATLRRTWHLWWSQSVQELLDFQGFAMLSAEWFERWGRNGALTAFNSLASIYRRKWSLLHPKILGSPLQFPTNANPGLPLATYTCRSGTTAVPMAQQELRRCTDRHALTEASQIFKEPENKTERKLLIITSVTIGKYLTKPCGKAALPREYIFCSHICFKALRGEGKNRNAWVLQAGAHLHGAHIRTSWLGNCVPRGWYVHLLMRSAMRKANISGLA